MPFTEDYKIEEKNLSNVYKFVFQTERREIKHNILAKTVTLILAEEHL